jgi:predicted nucleic acid-binding protein
MMIADTDVLIDYLTGRGDGATLVAAELRRGTLQTTVVTRFELLAGARTRRPGRSSTSSGSLEPVR